MATYHIHINGQVQGVGFRPYVYKLAKSMDVHGWVNNANDGVHIEFSATPGIAAQFYHEVIAHPPSSAIITHHHIREIASKFFPSFVINDSVVNCKPDLLFTPDIAICDECKMETLQNNNRWFNYPFTTCLQCGPRYSIIRRLPYDRHNTTMDPLVPCKDCFTEYNDVNNRRHYSQTISCSQCPIPMHLYNVAGDEISEDSSTLIPKVCDMLKEGNIVAVKGIGGYLVLCDPRNEFSIATLRRRKHRPVKPFALLYPTVESITADCELRRFEIKALQSKEAPIVLCNLNQEVKGAENLPRICTDLIAPGLNKIGVMLPYSPLLLLIATQFGKPLIATSGNISGSPIIFKDADALEMLKDIVDYILSYDREIVTPQDDSVIQFTPSSQKIILRRSRGLAPTYYPNPFKYVNESVLAMGSELKSAFALLNHHNLYVSQFLGDQGGIESQTAYDETLKHMLHVLQAKPDRLLVDQHPGYFVSLKGYELAALENIPVTSVQHHKAHFGAVLAENNLLDTAEPVLGVIWDGVGYGDDEQIWGGEFFMYEDSIMHRVGHFGYFSHLLGDKMSREPRLAALSLLKNFPSKQRIIQKHFSQTEWQYFEKQIHQSGHLLTSSVGRLLDGMAAILGLCQFNTYEGEAAMKLEGLASTHRRRSFDYYPLPFINRRLEHEVMLRYILEDLQKKESTSLIAWKLFCSLAKAIENVSHVFSIKKLAFSGGVFQNELLTELLIERLSQKCELYFHHQLSPNDESIGFGQIACYQISKNSLQTINNKRMSTAYVVD